MTDGKTELLKLIESYDEALRFWKSSLEASNVEIKAAKVEEPLEELAKLAKLIRAHTTKVGIIFKPENLKKDKHAALSTLKKLSETTVLLMSVVPQLEPATLSKIYYNEIVATIKLLLDVILKFVNDLKVLVNDEDSQDERLVSVGQVWTNCDELTKLVDNGKVAYLSGKTKQSIAILGDGLEEFEEWAENPESFDEDPFLLSDDEEEDEEKPPVSEDEEEETTDEEVSIFAKKWAQKIKLIKLLLTSLTRSLPTNTSGQSIDDIYNIQKTLVNNVDKFILDLMLEQQPEELKELGDSIDKNCFKIMKIVKEANTKSESKIKWVTAWHSKYTADS